MRTFKVPKSLQEVFDGFESLKQYDAAGDEYWSARELQEKLGYKEWRKFNGVINKAIKACETAGNDIEDHFVGSDKVLTVGNGAKMEVEDVHLTRHACYLTAQNGDSRKPEVGLAQTFFAVSTQKHQLNNESINDNNRLIGRIGYRESHKELSNKAVEVGVPNRNLGMFHDSGQRSMQGGLSVSEMKQLKGLPPEVNYPDYMGTAELSANMLRMAITTNNLSKGNIQGQQAAIQTHIDAGLAVRKLLADNDMLPENLPVLESTRQVVDKLKQIC